MNLLPTLVAGDVDTEYYFNNCQLNWSLDASVDVEESHPFYGLSVYLNYEKLEDEDGSSSWSIIGQDYPWFSINVLESDYTESEIERMKTLHNLFEVEKAYITNKLDNNLLPYEDIAVGKCTFWVRRNGDFLKKSEKSDLHRVSLNFERAEENQNRYNAYCVFNQTNEPFIVPEVDYSGIFINTPYEEQQNYKDCLLLQKIAKEFDPGEE